MNSPTKILKSEKVQNIKNGSESDYTSYITSKEVVVHCKTGIHTLGSSKVKLTNKIDYNWEFRLYQGQLVAVHIEGKILAYAMKGKDGGMVRVVNHETDQRALIKNLKTDVRDVSFAFLRNEIILGCVDDEANIFIYEIKDSPVGIKYKLRLHIYHPNVTLPLPSNLRMIWCPYLPSADEDPESSEETAKMFVFLNGTKAEVWDVFSLMEKCDDEPVSPNESYDCYVEIKHSMNIVDVSFSSDGTAIATACLDGLVKFYQIYLADNEKQKLLHEWVPHDGEALSCLIFIDNILEYSSDSRFWKFAITGANFNSELKLWSCETWTCLQSIHFKNDPASVIPHLLFKISIDHSGQYVVMSDINNKILYVLQIKRRDAEKLVAVASISQFLLPAPFLSYHITKAEISKVPSLINCEPDVFEDEEFDDENIVDNVCINMLVIQPRKFQECSILFPSEPPSNSIVEPIDFMENVKTVNEAETVPKLDDLQSSVTLLIQQQTNKSQLNLMTPENFSSPVPNSRASSVRNSLEPITMESKHGNASVENLIEFDRPQKSNFASGGSSPSREVQEILSLNNSTYSNQEYLENLSLNLQDIDKHYNQKESVFNDTSGSKELVWPKIPVVKDNGLVKDDGSLLNDDGVKDFYKNHLQTLNFRLTSLETALREQTVMLESLKLDMKSGRLKQINCESKEEITKELEIALSKHQLQLAKFLENMFNMQKQKERELYENLISSMSQLINKSLSDKIHNVVTYEIKHTVLPAVLSLMEDLKQQLELQYNQKTTLSDKYLKDNISKLVASSTLTESLSKSVVSVIVPNLEKCYRDMITSSLIPSWEKICVNMFHQINDTFTQGTREYTSSVESYLERQRKTQEKSKDILTQLNLVSENLKFSNDKLTHSVTMEVQKQCTNVFETLQDKLFTNVRDIISDEVKIAFKNHISVIEDSVLNAVRSRCVTPASHVIDSQVKFAKIQQLVANGNYEEALQTALSAENLQYVVYVCENADMNTLFGGSCNLPQNCLLALIQQLSMDLAQKTDIKLSFIHGAVLALNRHDPDTRRFVNKIMKDLAIQLNNFVSSNPPYQQKSNAMILLMAVENMSHTMFNLSI